MSFAEFHLPPQLLANLAKMGFETPTPIQAQAIPQIQTGQDLIGSAQTGTGKTAAFCLPLIDRLMQNPEQTAVILAPTRELAMQIMDVLKLFLRGIPKCEPALLIGGSSIHLQLKALQRRPRILVATPGRLLDHLNHKAVNLSKVGMLVLDEADRMLDMGFEPQLKNIRRFLPAERQTLLFSATFPKEILELANSYLKNPSRIEVGEVRKPVEKIVQDVIETTHQKKNDVLLDHLNAKKGSVLVFVRTKHRTERLTRYLQEYGYAVAQIHGGRSQAQRTSALKGFRSGQYRILVATDIASRGIDVQNIETVINYDLPDATEDYIHRIGRTARNGQSGQALCLLTPEDKYKWFAIQRHIQRKEGGGQPEDRRQAGSGWRPKPKNSSQRRPSFGRKNFSRSKPKPSRNADHRSR